MLNGEVRIPGVGPIPESLWAVASELAGQHGVFRTAQIIRLDYTKLKYQRIFVSIFVGFGTKTRTPRTFATLKPRSRRSSCYLSWYFVCEGRFAK